MGARGRKSSAELTLVQRAEEVLVVRRPNPPDCLSDDAAAEWREVVNTFAADHFPRATYPILEAYCCHAAQRRKVRQLIENTEEGEGSVGEYDKLLAMHERESRALAALAVRLNIASATHAKKIQAT